MDKTVRLNKYLANLGFASRRKVEELLQKSQVTVNGSKAAEPGIRINPEKDLVLINGKKPPAPNLEYYILNKPKGVISTAKDEKGRTTVVDLINSKERLYPVGRLDADSKGLILLTNDGELANKLTHPKYHTPKTYIALILGLVEDKKINILKTGVNLKDYKTAPAKVKILKRENDRTILEITLFEGKNHQIRRMCAVLKLNLLELKRIAIGPLNLADLENGKYRELTNSEISALKNYG